LFEVSSVVNGPEGFTGLNRRPPCTPEILRFLVLVLPWLNFVEIVSDSISLDETLDELSVADGWPRMDCTAPYRPDFPLPVVLFDSLAMLDDWLGPDWTVSDMPVILAFSVLFDLGGLLGLEKSLPDMLDTFLFGSFDVLVFLVLIGIEGLGIVTSAA
jgi:hypothetical protein